MVEETVRKIQETIDKLFSDPPKFSSAPVHKGTGETPLLIGRKRSHSSPLRMKLVSSVLEGSYSPSSGSSKSAQLPVCKPWDRHDFFNRLSTFKSITWFAKPKVLSPLECARRGWVNADVDTIVCSCCGARLLFATPSSWTLQQVEKAAMAFSLKLDSGHKALCPWINNSCAEEIAYFPDLLNKVLAEDYKRRTTSLSQLIALPAISLSIADSLSNSQLMQFIGPLSNSLSSKSCSTDKDTSESIPLFSYFQAKKLISLFGWEPYLLPQEVGSRDGQHYGEDAAVLITAAKNQSIKVYCLCNSDGTRCFGEQQFDPSSVILHCKLCGTTVGLWAFNNIPLPLEYIRVVGPEEINGRSISTDDLNAQEGSSGDNTQKNVAATAGTQLDFTIAGGPPPALLDYAPTISLPIIGKNLRSRIAVETFDKDSLTSEMPSHVEESHQLSSNSGTAHAQGASMENAPEEIFTVVANIPVTDFGDSARAECSTRNTGSGERESNRENVNKAENCGYSFKVSSIRKSLEFDPVKQHRPFCPWIMSSSNFTCGWQQTLSALEEKKELNNLTDLSTMEVRNPMALASRLFGWNSRKEEKQV